jgi:enoyl-CoA hydratase
VNIRVDINGAIAELVLDRPKKLNAMTPKMGEEIENAARAINENDDIIVVILRGEGSSFCAGSDLKALDEYKGPFHFRNRSADYPSAVRSLRKPCIAALQGWVLGGGLEMALSADIRIASKSTRIGVPEVTHGWVGAGGASQLLPRLIGYGKAMWLLLEGKPIDAERAYEWGIVERVVDEGEELKTAYELAGSIAEHGSVATETVKAAIRQSMSTTLEAGLRYENEMTALAFALGNDQAGREKFKKR